MGTRRSLGALADLSQQNVVDAVLNADEVKLVQRLLGDPTVLPQVFKTWLSAYVETNPPILPISQIVGFTQFTPNQVLTSGAVSTTSNTYVSLSGGPTFSNLADGLYLLLYGAQSNPTTGNLLYVSPSVNSATPSDTVAATVSTGGSISIMSATTVSLSNNGVNTVELQYKSSGGANSQFANRFLIAIKYANL